MKAARKRQGCGILGALGGVACLLLAAGCREAESHANSPSPGDTRGNPGGKPPGLTVAAARADLRVLPLRIPIVGTLRPAEDVIVSTETDGVLRRTFVDVGDIVEPGAPLAQVDEHDYQIAVAQARAALGETLARLGVTTVPDDAFDLTGVSTVVRAQAQLDNAKFTYDRLLSITGAVSGQEVNDAAAQLRIAEAERRQALDEAAALVATARQRQAQLRLAEEALTDAISHAPPMPTTLGPDAAEHWVVAERLVTEGQFLNRADQLFRLIIDNPLKLRSSVPERYAPHVRVGQQVELTDLTGAASLSGTITRVSPAVDRATRTFEIEAQVFQTASPLKPGAFATGAILAETATQVLCVPAEAVVAVGGNTRVFVIADGRAHQRDVRIGVASDALVEILAGLAPGERVATDMLAALADGMAVNIGSPVAEQP